MQKQQQNRVCRVGFFPSFDCAFFFVLLFISICWTSASAVSTFTSVVTAPSHYPSLSPTWLYNAAVAEKIAQFLHVWFRFSSHLRSELISFALPCLTTFLFPTFVVVVLVLLVDELVVCCQLKNGGVLQREWAWWKQRQRENELT